MENLQQQLRSIEAEHQARMAAWNQHSANNVHQQNMGGDSGDSKNRSDKTVPVGKMSGNGGLKIGLNYVIPSYRRFCMNLPQRFGPDK